MFFFPHGCGFSANQKPLRRAHPRALRHAPPCAEAEGVVEQLQKSGEDAVPTAFGTPCTARSPERTEKTEGRFGGAQGVGVGELRAFQWFGPVLPFPCFVFCFFVFAAKWGGHMYIYIYFGAFCQGMLGL